MSDKKNNFITRQVQQTSAFLTAYQELLELRDEWDALGYNTEISDDDIAGDNSHVTAAMLADAFTSLAAIKSLMDTGHKTNLFRLVP